MSKTEKDPKPKPQWCDHSLAELHKLAVEDPEQFEQLRKTHEAAVNPALVLESKQRVSQWLREGRIDAKTAAEGDAMAERGDQLGLAKLLGEHQALAPTEATKLTLKLAAKDLKWIDLTPGQRAQLFERDPKAYDALKASHDFRPATATRLR